jgi:hypothetical protein
MSGKGFPFVIYFDSVQLPRTFALTGDYANGSIPSD